MHLESELWARVADRICPALVRLLTVVLIVVLRISIAHCSPGPRFPCDRHSPQEQMLDGIGKTGRCHGRNLCRNADLRCSGPV
jgi:hypothetical protein